MKKVFQFVFQEVERELIDSQDGAKFDRAPPASRFPSAESPQIVIAVARQDGRFGIGWGPILPGRRQKPS